jgi:hypothetical protein
MSPKSLKIALGIAVVVAAYFGYKYYQVAASVEA